MKKQFNRTKPEPRVKTKADDNKEQGDNTFKPSKNLKLAQAMAALDNGYES